MLTVISAVVTFAFVWFVLRVMGKRELSDLSAFEMVLLFVIGDLMAESLLREDTSSTGASIAIGTLALLTVGLSWVGWRFPSLQPIVDGVPVIVLRDGELDLKSLALERLDAADIFEAARQKGIADLASVQLVVLEADGSFSFFEKSDAGS